VNALYFSTVSITTVGYGDELPDNDTSKVLTTIFLLFGVPALAICVRRLQTLYMSARINRTDFKLELMGMMRAEAYKERKSTPTLVEDEFVLYVLEKYGGIKRELMRAVREDFKRVEAFGLTTKHGDSEIDMRTLFDHLVLQGHIIDSNRVAPDLSAVKRRYKNELIVSHMRRGHGRKGRMAAVCGKLPWARMTATDGTADDDYGSNSQNAARMGVVDMSSADCGFDEWLHDVWTPYLEGDAEYHRVVAQSRVRVRMKVQGSYQVRTLTLTLTITLALASTPRRAIGESRGRRSFSEPPLAYSRQLNDRPSWKARDEMAAGHGLKIPWARPPWMAIHQMHLKFNVARINSPFLTTAPFMAALPPTP